MRRIISVDLLPDSFKAKNLGIWMDHANAHLMEFTTDPITTDIISNPFSHREKEHSLSKSEDGNAQQRATVPT